MKPMLTCITILLAALFLGSGCSTTTSGGRQRKAASPPPDAMSPNAFWFNYEYDPEGRRLRLWSKESQGIWVERYPTGQTTRYKFIGTGTVDENSGIIVRRLPDEVMDVFIPDIHAKGTNPKWLRFRLNSDGKWNYLAEIHLFSGE